MKDKQTTLPSPRSGLQDSSQRTQQNTAEQEPPKEIGGRDGPDPVRFGDWEKGGRCIDF